jgi:hypothetical protein
MHHPGHANTDQVQGNHGCSENTHVHDVAVKSSEAPDGVLIVYAALPTAELRYAALVARALRVSEDATETGVEYVEPAEHVPGVEAAGSEPSVV